MPVPTGIALTLALHLALAPPMRTFNETNQFGFLSR